jgi:hypothetical protein
MFADDLKKFTRKVEARARVIHQVSGLETISRIISRTPVLTGRLRGNMNLGLGSADLAAYSPDKDGGATLARAQSRAAGVQPGTDIVISNNLPYARRIENGYSQKAPAGMFAVTVAEFPEIQAGALAVAKQRVP